MLLLLCPVFSNILVMHCLQAVLKYTGADLAPGCTPPTAQEQIEMVLKIYKHTLKRAELRDELFAQLSKQTRNNLDR
jgi:hypothetical protein